MKALSAFIILQGFAYGIQSLILLQQGVMVKFGTKLISTNFNIIGIILGIGLIMTGAGVWQKKKMAYHATLVIYSLLITYGIGSMGYILITQGLDWIPTILCIVIVTFFGMIIRFTRKNKSEFM